jgi:intraflagellar transport protein 80
VVAWLDSENKIHVQDVTQENVDELSFRDRVIKMSIGFNYLIVATATQISIYNIVTWSTPISFDLKDTVNIIVQSEKYFVTVDNFTGIQVYSYEGRIVSNPKFAGLRTEFVSRDAVSLSREYLAMLDRTDRRLVHIVDVTSGRVLENAAIKHSVDIVALSLSQFGNAVQRKIAFIDKNQDLWICAVNRGRAPKKVASMVNSAMWNDKSDLLAAIVDGNLTVWYYPNTIYFDRDLAVSTKHVRETR